MTGIDEIAVHRVVEGDDGARLTKAERRAAIEEMHRRGYDVETMARRLHTNWSWVREVVNSLGGSAGG